MGENGYFFVVSPYLSHDIPFLFEELKPHSIIWAINDPKYTVTSFYNKGWYIEDLCSTNADKIFSINPRLSLNQSLGRLIPQEDEFLHWKSLTRVGQIAWFYNKINTEIDNELQGLPPEKVKITN